MTLDEQLIAAGTTPARAPLWRDAKIRSLFYQALTLILLAAGIGYLAYNTVTNLEQRGIASGFRFLEHPTGFGVLFTLIEYSEASTYGRAYIVGIVNTLFVSAIGVVLATILGVTMGVARLSSNWLVAKLATVYVEVVRNIPLLLQILFWYGVFQQLPSLRQSVNFGDAIFINLRGIYLPRPIFESGAEWILAALIVGILATIGMTKWAHRRQDLTGQQFPLFQASVALIVGLPVLAALATGLPVSFDYPELKGFNFRGGMVILPELMALALALTVYTAAFIAEAVRAGIQAVSRGQTEASYSLGLRPGPTLRLVVFPQALRVILPPLTSQYLNLTKNSSLAPAIAYPDLVHIFAGTVLNQTGQAVECIVLTMAVYFTISLLISAFMNWYNRRIALVER